MTDPDPSPLYYLDTNAIWKFYQDQKGDLNIRRLVASSQTQILVSPLTLLEFIGVLMKYYRQKRLKRKDIHSIARRIRRDSGIGKSNRPFKVIQIPVNAVIEATNILLQHGSEFDFQTNDALHLAIVLHTSASVKAPIILVTSDNSLQRAAEKKGTSWYDPEAILE